MCINEVLTLAWKVSYGDKVKQKTSVKRDNKQGQKDPFLLKVKWNKQRHLTRPYLTYTYCHQQLT